MMALIMVVPGTHKGCPYKSRFRLPCRGTPCGCPSVRVRVSQLAFHGLGLHHEGAARDDAVSGLQSGRDKRAAVDGFAGLDRLRSKLPGVLSRHEHDRPAFVGLDGVAWDGDPAAL